MSDAISLDLARENGIHTIAFPAISTGVYGYPVREATKVAVDAVKKWLEDNSDYPMEVTFCCFDERTRGAHEEYLNRTSN